MSTDAAGRPEDVLSHIGPGADVIVPLANGEPVAVLDALEAHAGELEGVRVHQMNALRERAYIRGEFGDHLRHVSYFLSPATRPAYWNGTVDLVPNHFSEVPMLLKRTTKWERGPPACCTEDRAPSGPRGLDDDAGGSGCTSVSGRVRWRSLAGARRVSSITLPPR